ncbi:MAG: cysteine desulfurase family protein [Mariprofundaceae bacterium]
MRGGWTLRRYLDANATCPMVAAAIEAVSDAARRAPGNPSSLHWAGREARRIVDDARDALAAHLGAEPGSVVFTSGGTEANNIAIASALADAGPGGRVVASAIEHPSVLEPLRRWSAERGSELVLIRPDREGRVDAGAMLAQVDEHTHLVCLMLANNETGVIQPALEVARAVRERGVPVLVDAVQALGKLTVNFADSGADFMSFSAHKIGGPKGVGALLVRRGVRLREIAPGGGQERGRRSGTENVPGIAGFAAALGVADFQGLANVRDAFERMLAERLAEARIIGRGHDRLPNTSLLILPGVEGETLLMQLDLAGFAVASGSACSSGKRGASHVLLAMGMDEPTARASIRVSFAPPECGLGTDAAADAAALVDALAQAIARLRAMAGLAA